MPTKPKITKPLPNPSPYPPGQPSPQPAPLDPNKPIPASDPRQDLIAQGKVSK